MGSPIFTQTPNPDDVLAVSQVDLLNNAVYLQTTLSKDHNIKFGSNASSGDTTQGYHTIVHWIDQTNTNPSRPSGANSMLWSSSKNLYWKCSGTTGIAMTNAKLGNPTVSANGATFLPGSIILQWGVFTSTSSTAGQSVSFVKTFSANADVYSIQCTPTNSGSGIRYTAQVKAATSSGFTAYVFGTSTSAPVGSINCYWMAVGTLDV